MRLKKSVGLISAVALGFHLQGCSRSEDMASAPSLSPKETISCDQNMSLKNYFEEIDTSAGVAPTEGEGVIRERFVKVNLDSLKQDILMGSPVLHLALFQDRSIDIVVEKIRKSKDNKNIVVTGHLKEDPLGSAVISIHDNVLIAHVNPLQDTHYKVIYKENGAHAILESDNKDDENEESCIAENSVQIEGEEAAQEVAIDDPSNEALATIPVIDMLVAYTPNARIAAGGTSAIVALIQSGIENTNRAFTNSGVNLQVRLVGTLALTQNESSNFSSDLSALKSKTDGKWDSVHSARTRLGADQVTVVGNYSGSSTAGIGYIGSSLSTAFTIVKRSAFSQYTFSHELGHNIGLYHSDGYVNSAGRFRTIMAYGSYTRIRRFSNPRITYNGYRTGDSDQNSAYKLNLRGKTIAALVPAIAQDEMTEVAVNSIPSCQR